MPARVLKHGLSGRFFILPNGKLARDDIHQVYADGKIVRKDSEMGRADSEDRHADN